MSFRDEKAQLLLRLLICEHAEDYIGTDDDMPDACDDWISSLTDDELCDIILTIFREST